MYSRGLIPRNWPRLFRLGVKLSPDSTVVVEFMGAMRFCFLIL